MRHHTFLNTVDSLGVHFGRQNRVMILVFRQDKSISRMNVLGTVTMMPQRTTIGAVIVIVAIIALGGIYFATLGSNSASQSNNRASDNSTSQSNNGYNVISVNGLGLCSGNCIYPSPYASATVTINATVPISTLEVYINNTYDGLVLQNPYTTKFTCTSSAGQNCSFELGGNSLSNGTHTSSTEYYATCYIPASTASCSGTYTESADTLTAFAYGYKGSIPNNLIPVIQGDTYSFTFVATFQDGSTASATASTVAN